MWAITLLLITSFVHFSEPFVCPECDLSACTPKTCDEGEELRPGFCNCCLDCIKILKKGEQCGSFSFLLPALGSTNVCDDNLMCHEGVCKSLEEVLKNIVKIGEAESKNGD
ncbi:unnamed protein product [Psylliodes chrysocephalus]|uniref:IGFBP N-terminal domain-containing protein n=1 Tax=Psylliodes chrysocephalus TaxID=3402493 RepID=A0A9P0D5X4_9CUCU|nr:unnamed protein product [Psylliodes chrysocephala]